MKKILKILFNWILRIKYGKSKVGSAYMENSMDTFGKIGAIEKPEEGGIFTTKNYAKYPYPGFISSEDLESMSTVKRLIPLGVDIINKLLKPYRPTEPKLYSKPVRELYRVMMLAVDRHEHFMPKRFFGMVANIICTLLERDDAYRPIFQDIFPEIDMEKIKMDDLEEYWFCHKPYNFGGDKDKAKWDKIRKDRVEYEMSEQENLENKMQERMEVAVLKKERVREIASKIVPDLQAVLDKHGVRPDFNNPAEEQVDIPIRIKIPKKDE